MAIKSMRRRLKESRGSQKARDRKVWETIRHEVPEDSPKEKATG